VREGVSEKKDTEGSKARNILADTHRKPMSRRSGQDPNSQMRRRKEMKRIEERGDGRMITYLGLLVVQRHNTPL